MREITQIAPLIASISAAGTNFDTGSRTFMCMATAPTISTATTAAAGLVLTMLMGIATRIRIGDSLVQMLPAIVLLLLNVFVLGVAIT